MSAGFCLCGHTDEEHDDDGPCTVWDCECPAFEFDQPLDDDPEGAFL